MFASQKKCKKNQGHGHSRVSHGWRSIDRTQHWDRPHNCQALTKKRTKTAEIHWWHYKMTKVSTKLNFRKQLGFGRCIPNSNLSSLATTLKQYSCASHVDIVQGFLEGSSANIADSRAWPQQNLPWLLEYLQDTQEAPLGQTWLSVLKARQRKQKLIINSN